MDANNNPAINLINRFGRKDPLVITRAFDSTEEDYDTTTLEVTEDEESPITFYVKGAIVPKSMTDYQRAEVALSNQVLTDKQAYILAFDIYGNEFVPAINDIVTADKDYRVLRVNEIEIGSQYLGFILDLGV